MARFFLRHSGRFGTSCPKYPENSYSTGERRWLCIWRIDNQGTKASVVQVREAKDYIDIDALIAVGKVDLPLALSAAQGLYGSTFNPQITLKALSFFDDGDLRLLPEDVKLRLVTAAREVDLDHLPGL